MPYPVRLVGARTVLREFTLEDADDVHAIVGDDRVTQWLSFDTRDRDGAQVMLAAAIESSRAEPRTEYYLAVTASTDERAIGFARLALSGVKAAKLGYAIHADHWANGYATDAARTLVDYGFRELGLHRVTAAVGPTNEASLTLLKRLSFVHEGRLRDHVFTNGAWRDSLLTSVLEHERRTPNG